MRSRWLVMWLIACGSTSAPPAPPSPPGAAPVDAAPDADAAPHAASDARADVALDAPAAPITAAPTSGAMAPIVLQSPYVQPADLACKVDADCVIVHDIECCNCSSGGTGVVVNRRRVAAIKAGMRKRCREPIACADVLSGDPTCLPGYPVCAERVCAIQPGER